MSELQKAVADILVKATQAAEAAGKFAVEQLPDVAQQYVLFVAIYSWMWVILSVIIFTFPFILYKVFKVDGENAVFAGMFSTFISGMMFFLNIKNALLATFAPKVLLIQWAADLVK